MAGDKSFLTKDTFLDLSKHLGIKHVTRDHEEVFTVEAMMPHVQDMPGIHNKNLFLKDKKKRLYLLSARYDREVKLADVGKMVGASGGLRLADEMLLYEKLGVKQGCVTAFALANDVKKEVSFLCDACLLDGDTKELVYFHPISNAATTGISRGDFKTFLSHTGHTPVSVKFE